jgi:hypothetical protein
VRIEFTKTGTPSPVLCVSGLSRAFSMDQWAAQFTVRASPRQVGGSQELRRAQSYGAVVGIQFSDAGTGSAIVEYVRVRDAVQASNALQGQVISGSELRLSFELKGGANSTASAAGHPPPSRQVPGGSASAPGVRSPSTSPTHSHRTQSVRTTTYARQHEQRPAAPFIHARTHGQRGAHDGTKETCGRLQL